MENLEINSDEVIRSALNNNRIEGFFCQDDGSWALDRRYNLNRTGLNPRTADLNLMGPAILPVPEYLVEELGLEDFKK